MQTVAAVPFAWGLVQGTAKSGRARKATRKAPGKAHREQPVVTKEHGVQSGQVASEVATFERMQEVQNKAPGWSWLGKCALLLISVAVAGVSFGLTVSPSFVAVLLGVLFFHELGHWFGMWLFDYRDRQMLFLPFLGAAVTGNKEDATPMQQIIVALLGPVPGLILGTICLQWAPESGESLLRQIGWTALALNYLNLLPVNPLDGGRIVDLLLSRFPWLRLAFGLVSVLVLLFVGLTRASIMAGVAVAMMFTLAAQWRMNIALQRLRKLAGATPATNRRERLSAIFQVLTQAPFHRQQAATRYELAKSLLRYLTTGPANWRTMFLGGTAYAAALLVPVYIGVKTAVATFHKEIATMDANCIPRTQPVMTTSLQDMLSKNEQQPTVVVHEVIAHIRAKVPCLADSQTYDLSDLTDDERLLWDLYWFDVKLSLGGFRTVFENDSANAAKLLTELERIGALQSKALLERSLEAFPDKRMPETPEAIRAVLRQIDEDKSHPAHALWTQLHGEFVEQHMQEVDDHLHAYIRQHMASLSMPQALAQALPEKTAPALMVEKKPRRRE
jgi:Zn-dependent protease